MELSKLKTRQIAIELAPGETLNITRRTVTIDDQRALENKQREIRRRLLEVGKEAQEKAKDASAWDLQEAILTVEERAAKEAEAQGHIAVLLDILTGWDLTDDGKPVAIAEGLPLLDSRFIKLIHDAVWEDINPNPKQP